MFVPVRVAYVKRVCFGAYATVPIKRVLYCIVSCKAIPPETTLAPWDSACQVQALPTYVQVIAWSYSDIHH